MKFIIAMYSAYKKPFLKATLSKKTLKVRNSVQIKNSTIQINYRLTKTNHLEIVIVNNHIF